MKHALLAPALALTLALLPPLAAAQTVWRCGADGSRYADEPCAGGRVVAVADPRSDDMVAQARAVADNDRRLARELAAERREREALAFRQGAAALTVSTTIRQRPPEPAPRALQASKRRPGAGAGTSRKAGRASRRETG